MLMLSTLSPRALLAAGTGNQTPLVIGALVIILIAAIAAAVSLRKS
jgi:hypothetical protein